MMRHSRLLTVLVVALGACCCDSKPTRNCANPDDPSLSTYGREELSRHISWLGSEGIAISDKGHELDKETLKRLVPGRLSFQGRATGEITGGVLLLFQHLDAPGFEFSVFVRSTCKIEFSYGWIGS
jgi:hypothetical protein